MLEYKKFLLSRLSVTTKFTEFVEYCIVREEESSKHAFHKIMIHNWVRAPVDLFKTMSDYYSTHFVPIHYSINGEIMSFYTSSLNLIMKIIKQDFMFPSNRAMYSVDILFNDKTSEECFGQPMTLEDMISSVVSNRFNEKCELNLSNFCDDQVFIDNKIHMYKLVLLANFKILMIRMGRDTKSLNLSHNKLTTVPAEIMNFFMKSNLESVDLSYNNFAALSDIRLSSKVERLWLEGNPLCENFTALSYVKQCVMKFPRLIELDGIEVNRHGVIFPFWRNYLPENCRKLKMLVEKFLMLFFSHYDSYPRKGCSRLYNEHDSTFTINIDRTIPDLAKLQHYKGTTRNFLDNNYRHSLLEIPPDMLNTPHMAVNKIKKVFYGRKWISSVQGTLPKTIHDPNTFSVDVVKIEKNTVLVVVDGIFKEINENNVEKIFQFRRSFILAPEDKRKQLVYVIFNDVLTISPATKDQVDNSFRYPLRNLSSLMLVDPTEEQKYTISKIFAYYTRLNKMEIKTRLEAARWDIKAALYTFKHDFSMHLIKKEMFQTEDSDGSIDYDSLLD